MPLDSNLVDRLIEKVKKNVGRSGDTTLDDYVLEWLNNGQKKVCNEMNFWFMKQQTTINFTQGDNTEALPSNFKDDDLVSLQLTVGSTTSWEPLEYLEWDDVRKDFDNTTQGQPTHWIIQQKNLILWPKPDAAYTVALDYYGYLTDLTEPDGDTNYLVTDYPDLLEAYATARAFQQLREFGEYKEWMNTFMSELQALKISSNERELPDELVLRVRADAKSSAIYRPKGRM